MRTKVNLFLVENGADITVVVTGSVTPFRRGRSSGPGEVRDPDEGGDVEIEESTLDGAPYDLTRQQERQAKDLLLEKVADEGDGREDPRDDYDRAEA